MEKLVYVLKTDQALTVESLRECLLGEIVTGLRSLGGRRMTINVADLNEQIESDSLAG